ncbi:hypothetical protein D8M04_15160 [Oceanobacillus piezotolerans]|uniref:Uncharacterized protein n=1 Tax=Oceanobacillus piezotolerans TaxID=2448030 RepID=A0A498DKD1_9BACI|nr:hypothetical protein [Oceanobacillus piezotolerans]RLL42885.1 hypothetical protein D8M04_15160 [Oceanobacillus piezotolerans]
MIDLSYLEKFGEKRFDMFYYGEEIKQGPCTQAPVAYIDMDFLKNHDHLPEWESFLYKVFSSVERIYRIDFHSKYYFHSASPTARNISSVKLILAYQKHLYRLNPISDQIEVRKNDFLIGLDGNTMHLLLVADDRRLQRDYGDFHKILSMLNIGHALMNVELALGSEGVYYQEVDTASITQQRRTPFLSVVKVLEIQSDEKKTSKHNLEDLFEWTQKRSSNQSLSGDVFVNEIFRKGDMLELLTQLDKLLKKMEIGISIYINHVEGFDNGYYRFYNGELIKVSDAENQLEANRILAEYQSYTNVTGLNLWLFFHFHPKFHEYSYDSSFINMGYIAQYLSLLATKWGKASRGMKNYKDVYIKKKLDLPETEFIGYSLMIFPKTNSTSSSYIKF